MGACKRYVIFTPGRTGSTLIYNNLSTDRTNTVLHMHNNKWVPYRENFICILSKRKDLFASVISNLVMHQTGEIQTYSGNQQPFKIEPNRFIRNYASHQTFYDKIQLNCYSTVVDIWFEQLINDTGYLFKQLGMKGETDYSSIQKSPYDYSKLVTNYYELKEIAQAIDKTI